MTGATRFAALVLLLTYSACNGKPQSVPEATRAETMSTDFRTTENPLSGGGNWINGNAVGLDWKDVQTADGSAFAADFAGSPSRYSDAIAHLTAKFSPNQYAEAVVYRAPGYSPSVGHEIELLLRFQVSAHRARGYEVLWAHNGGLAIVRWNGSVGSYTPLIEGIEIGPPVSGDVLRAEMLDGVVRVYKNDVLVATSPRDTTWHDGHPGIGFWPLHGAALTSFGWRSFSAGALSVPGSP